MEDIFRILLMAQDAAGNAQDHGPVPAHQPSESGLIALGDEVLKQLQIRLLAGNLGGRQLADPLKHSCPLGIHHGFTAPAKSTFYMISTLPGRLLAEVF